MENENIVASDPTPSATPPVAENKLVASRIARGEVAPSDGPGQRVRVAHKDYNARGKCREHWFRLAFRGGAWVYLGDRRLNNGTFLAADRHDTVYDEVFPGEVVAQHDRGGPIDEIFLVVDDAEKPLVKLTFGKTRDGQLRIELPDSGSPLRLPNPRR